MYDEIIKRELRDEFCNLVEFRINKSPVIPSGYIVTDKLQSEEKFTKLLDADKWGIATTIQSNIILADLDTDEIDEKFWVLFNRERSSFKDGKYITSRHGMIKVTDADHDWCLSFAKKYSSSNLELFVENQHMIVAGEYNRKKEKQLEDGEKMTTSSWSGDDSILLFTKEKLEKLFENVKENTEEKSEDNSDDKETQEKIPAGEGLRHKGIKKLLYNKVKLLEKSKNLINNDVLRDYIFNCGLIEDVTDYTSGEEEKELENLIEYAIVQHKKYKLKRTIFTKAAHIFEYQKEEYEFGLSILKVHNKELEGPFSDGEVELIVKSAWDMVQKKLQSYINGEMISYKNPAKIELAADILMEKYNFVTLAGIDRILLYNGKIYSNQQAETVIKTDTENLIQFCTKSMVSEVTDKIKRRTFVKIENFDSDSNSITIDNGILDINLQQLSPHTPKNKSQILIPVSYVSPTYKIREESIFSDIQKNLCDTEFYKYLVRSFTVNGKFRKKDFEIVLSIMASMFIKKQIDQKAFMNLGGGENGKSIFLEYITSLMGGRKNVTHIPLQELSNDKFMASGLYGICANIFSDLEGNELKRTGKIKAIISNEGIRVQEKYEKSFDMHPFCKLIFSCNRFPKVYDQSQGFFRRWIIVKWERSFEGDPERVPDLLEKLISNQNEKNTVFSALMPLTALVNRNGKYEYDKSWKNIQKEWNENSDPISSFILNYIEEVFTEGVRETKIDTFQFYKETMFELGENPLSIRQFGREFGEVFDESKVDGIRYWLNIRFRRPKQENMEEFQKSS